MNTTYIIVAVVLVLVIVGLILGSIFTRRKRSDRFHDEFGLEYDRTVQAQGNEKKAQAELDARRKHVTSVIWLTGLLSNPILSTNRGRRSEMRTA
jgi:FtsZ-interacting cell division protein ZipA